MNIQGYDIDGEIVKAARQNAELAGVNNYIHFQKRAVSELSSPKKYGFIITNPPYGERLERNKLCLAYTEKLETPFLILMHGHVI